MLPVKAIFCGIILTVVMMQEAQMHPVFRYRTAAASLAKPKAQPRTSMGVAERPVLKTNFEFLRTLVDDFSHMRFKFGVAIRSLLRRKQRHPHSPQVPVKNTLNECFDEVQAKLLLHGTFCIQVPLISSKVIQPVEPWRLTVPKHSHNNPRANLASVRTVLACFGHFFIKLACTPELIFFVLLDLLVIIDRQSPK